MLFSLVPSGSNELTAAGEIASVGYSGLAHSSVLHNGALLGYFTADIACQGDVRLKGQSGFSNIQIPKLRSFQATLTSSSYSSVVLAVTLCASRKLAKHETVIDLGVSVLIALAYSLSLGGLDILSSRCCLLISNRPLGRNHKRQQNPNLKAYHASTEANPH